MSENSRRRGMHPLLAFFLGFLLAFIIFVGAVAGVVIYALNYKLDKISANKDAEGNYIFINADPSDGGVGTVMDLIKKVSEMSKGYGNMTVGEVENLIPVMSSLTGKLETELSNYVTLEEGELQEVTLGGLGAYVSSLAERVNVAKLIGTKTDNAILVYMSYGVHELKEVDGVWHAKYKDEYSEEEEPPVYDCILEFKEDDKIDGAYYLNEDGEKVYTPYLTLENVKDRVGGVCEELTIGEIMPIVEGDKILGSIKNSTVNTISDDINNLCIQQIFCDEVYAPKTSKDNAEYPKAQIYEAVNETPSLTSGWVSADTIYYEYDSGNNKYTLAGNNGKLTSDEYDEYDDLYTLGEGKIMYNPAYLYYTMDEAGDIKMVNAGLDNAGRAVVPEDGGKIYTYGAASPLWKLLLHIENSEGVKEEQAFTFNNVGTLITNVSKNTQGTPLRELHAAGILTFDGHEEDLEIEITLSDGTTKQKLGDTPLSEVITVAVSLFKLLPPS